MSDEALDLVRSRRRAERERQQAEKDAARKADPVKYRANLAMERLRGILENEPPLWSAWQASWYLTGVFCDLSEERVGDEAPLYVWLPGAREHFSTEQWLQEQEVEHLHDYVSGFCRGESRTPQEWVRHSLHKKHRPVWLDAAFADAACRKLLPADILKRFGVAADGAKRQSRAALAMHAKNPASKAIASLEPAFRVWFANCPRKANGKPVRGAISAWAEQMAQKLLDEQGVEVQKESIETATLRWRKRNTAVG